ncbi:(2Fe-2S)-binding protein [Thalassotalea loyana]|uniref:(2Fe-2S)-binding protein n=1 Tax=Thalassotalea loyana TaxID=280483 RepID=A0ABQ6HH34_9GAMM|nr:(2Fe-2S)-binding protein [Thalassotalea loyana]GLX86949.1 (2Fe-2S)-binding protein [Thalassotalea loyana]
MIKLNINNQDVELNVEQEMPLLYAVRDELKLTGTKFGCGAGQCGACTVHIDGQAMRSCITPISFAQGKNVTTIEGLDPNNDHELQITWREFNVPQCGYCQSGQIMNAAALLSNNANPSDEDIDNAMQGNICRCGTYPRIKAAIKKAAQLKSGNKA